MPKQVNVQKHATSKLRVAKVPMCTINLQYVEEKSYMYQKVQCYTKYIEAYPCVPPSPRTIKYDGL